jgi:hypothetical protein
MRAMLRAPTIRLGGVKSRTKMSDGEDRQGPQRRHLPAQAGTFLDRRDADALSRLESESAESVIESGLWKYHKLLPPVEDSPRRRKFHRLLIYFLYYTCVWIPMRVTFFVYLRESTAWRVMDAVDFGIDACFILDVVMNFRTAYYNHEHELVTDWHDIGARYLAFWFWIEAFATIPWDLLAGQPRVRAPAPPAHRHLPPGPAVRASGACIGCASADARCIFLSHSLFRFPRRELTLVCVLRAIRSCASCACCVACACSRARARSPHRSCGCCASLA